MRKQMIPWIDLRPIESARSMEICLYNDILGKIKEIKNGKIYPIKAVRYLGGKFIVPDGHRRTVAHMLRGSLEIPAMVYEKDSDIRNFPCDFFKREGFKIKSLDRLFQVYETETLPDLERDNIRGFNDYAVLKEMARRGIGI